VPFFKKKKSTPAVRPKFYIHVSKVDFLIWFVVILLARRLLLLILTLLTTIGIEPVV